MKQIFKRTLATATGSLLVLSQIAATAVNISAADTAAGDKLTVDRAFIVDVDILDSDVASYVGDTFDLSTIEDSETPVTGATHDKAPHSLWAGSLETHWMQQVGNGGKQEVATDAAKAYVKKALLKVGYVTEKEANDIVNALAATAQVEFKEDLSATVSMDCANIGEPAGAILVNAAKAKGVKFETDEGVTFNPTWNGVEISGKIDVTVKLDPATKTVSYNAVVTDETTKEHTSLETLLGDSGYVLTKFEEMCKHVKEEAKAFATESAAKKAQELLEQLMAEGLSETEAQKIVDEEVAKHDLDAATDFEKEFDEARAELEGKIDDITAAVGAVANTKVDTLTVPDEGFAGAQKIYDAYKDALKASATEAGATLITSKIDSLPANVQDALTSDRFDSIVSKGVGFANSLLGDKADVNLTAADIAELAQLAYDYEFTAKDGTSFDVKFSMDDNKEEQEKLIPSVASAVEAAVAAYNTANGTNKEFVTANAHKEVTLSTTNDLSAFTGSVTYDVKLVIDELVFRDADETTSTTTTTETPGSSTSASAEIVVNGLDETGKIYWSEETAAIDLSAVTATLNIYVDGQISQTRTVSQYFGADEATIGDIAFDGFNADGYKVSYKLKDAAGLTQVITAAGFDASLASTFTEGQSFGEQTVYLVLRGDVDLDNDVDIDDATNTLVYYNDTQVSGDTGYQSIQNGAFLAGGAYASDPTTYGKFGHYAADVDDVPGLVGLDDATGVLAYYNLAQVAGVEATWLEAVGTEVTPADANHTDPFAGDTYYGGPAA